MMKIFLRYVTAAEAIREGDMHQWMNKRHRNIWHLKNIPWFSMEGMAEGSNCNRCAKTDLHGNSVIIQTTCFSFENLWDSEYCNNGIVLAYQ